MDNDRIKILLVDDDEDDYVITRDLLSEVRKMNYELQWVAAYDLALEVIKKGNHDVYLFDYRLGSRNGLDLLRETAANGCRAPIILMTGQEDHEVDVEAKEQMAYLQNEGCHDMQRYLFSPPITPEDVSALLEKEKDGRGICLQEP